MHRSSTSSSDGDRPGGEWRPRRWRLFFAILLACLAATEAALRFAPVRSLLPPRTHYYHPAISQRLDALERVLMVHRRVDVLFVGSSIVVTNVHPLLFDHLVGQLPGTVVSFNAGLAGLWPTSVHLYTEHVWVPVARPRVVVQGVRYPELATTTHAKNETQVWTGNIEPAWRDADVMTRLYAGAVSRLYLLQYRGAGTRLLQRFRNGWAGEHDPETDETYAVRGHTPRGLSEQPPDQQQPDLPNEGTCEAGRCAVGFAALRRTIEAVQAAGADYVLLNVPEHPARWRVPGGVDRYRRYIEQLRAFAAAHGVGFIDPTDGDPFRFEDAPYNDLSHMTAAGARQFTSALADRMAPLLEASLRAADPVRASR